MRADSFPSQTRRSFLLAAATGSFVIAQIPLRGNTADTNSRRPLVVDTHVHCFADKDDPNFPYHDLAPYRPDAPATPQHLLKCMNEIGIDYAIIVHPEPYQDEHRYLEYCLEIGKGRFKGTCLFFADRPGSIAKMPALVKRVPIVAIRVHAYAPDRLPPFGKPELRELWRIAADHGLAVQIHFEPRYAPGFEPLIKDFPDTRVIIDHLGRPFQGTSEEHAKVVRWSVFKNTIMKISAIPPVGNYPHRDPGPIIKQLVEAYGPDRTIYGGGFGNDATAQSYRATLDRSLSAVSFLPASEQRKILGGNAAHLFGFNAAP